MNKYLSEKDMSTGEYISRDEVLKIFHQYCDNCLDSYNGVMCRACGNADAMDILIDMPAADVQPVKHGHWIIVPDKHGDKFLCSNCGTAEQTESGEDGAVWWHDEYCRKCGTRMDGDTE